MKTILFRKNDLVRIFLRHESFLTYPQLKPRGLAKDCAQMPLRSKINSTYQMTIFTKWQRMEGAIVFDRHSDNSSWSTRFPRRNFSFPLYVHSRSGSTFFLPSNSSKHACQSRRPVPSTALRCSFRPTLKFTSVKFAPQRRRRINPVENLAKAAMSGKVCIGPVILVCVIRATSFCGSIQ